MKIWSQVNWIVRIFRKPKLKLEIFKTTQVPLQKSCLCNSFIQNLRSLTILWAENLEKTDKDRKILYESAEVVESWKFFKKVTSKNPTLPYTDKKTLSKSRQKFLFFVIRWDHFHSDIMQSRAKWLWYISLNKSVCFFNESVSCTKIYTREVSSLLNLYKFCWVEQKERKCGASKNK